MPRLHPNIAHKEAQKILHNESLLCDADRQLVEEIRQQVKRTQAAAAPNLQALQKTWEENIKTEKMLQNAHFASGFISDIRTNLTKGYKKIDTVLADIESYITDGALYIGENIKTIDDLINHFKLQKENLNSDNNKLQLISMLTTLETQQHANVEQLQNARDQWEANIVELNERIDIYRAQLTDIQTKLSVKFDVDNHFELTKISKGKNGPEFSVIFAKTEKGMHPYILYRSKEYKEKIRRLGENIFGKIKLAQDYESHELVAVKGQFITALPEQILQEESTMLDEMRHLKGTIQCPTLKDYIVKELHYGKKLESIIKERNLTDIDALQLLRQAATELQKMHDKNLIHRDIKLENFIWDREMSKCVLIDLAFVETVNGDKMIKRRDEAGSESHLSPEALQGNYSKRSDIYAFGVMMNEVLERHSAIRVLLKNEIDQLAKENVEKRSTSLRNIISKLNILHTGLTQKTSTIKNRPTTLTSLHNSIKSHEKLKNSTDSTESMPHNLDDDRSPTSEPPRRM